MVGSSSPVPVQIISEHEVLADFLRAAFDKKTSIKHADAKKHDQPNIGLFIDLIRIIIGLLKCTCAYRCANEHCVMKRLEGD